MQVLIGIVLFTIGHLAIWCTIFNQVHATRCPRTARRGTELLTILNVILLGIAGLYLAVAHPNQLDLRNLTTVFAPPDWDLVSGLLAILVGYWHLCQVVSLGFIVRWIYRRATDQRPDFWIEHQHEDLDLNDDDPDLLHGLPTQLAYALVPGNQLLDLRIEDKTFAFPQLPAALDGLKVTHLSDLHFTGRVGLGYFQEVIRRTNLWEPDLVCITGDLLDKRQCLDWIESTYGQLRARLGVFYILGNHDRRIRDIAGLRSRLASNGLVDVNGQWVPVPVQRNGQQATIWLAGNELPWFSGAENVSGIDTLDSDRQESFYVSLCHSPDQLHWSRQLGADLMLAGHTHGGQVRLPIIGPIVAPSRYGVRYASGVFKIGKMAMQVSRGISGADPLRWNCPPELCQMTWVRKRAQ